MNAGKRAEELGVKGITIRWRMRSWHETSLIAKSWMPHCICAIARQQTASDDQRCERSRAEGDRRSVSASFYSDR